MMSTPPIRVLLVDPDPVVLHALVRQLEHLGAHAIPTRSVGEALATLRGAPPPELVLTELELPDGGGEALLRALRGDDGLAAIPVVAMSSIPTDAPFDRYLEKPFARGELRDLVRIARLGAGAPEEDDPGRRLRRLPPLDLRSGPARRAPQAAVARMIRAVVDEALSATAA